MLTKLNCFFWKDIEIDKPLARLINSKRGRQIKFKKGRHYKCYYMPLYVTSYYWHTYQPYFLRRFAFSLIFLETIISKIIYLSDFSLCSIAHFLLHEISLYFSWRVAPRNADFHVQLPLVPHSDLWGFNGCLP